MGTAYRYWRLNVVPPTGLTFTMYEVQMRVARDGSGTNLSTTGGGTASAGATSAGTAAQAFDGNTATAWNTIVATWLQWDFGAGNAQDIQHFAVYGGSGSAGSISFDGSNNLVDWERRAYKAGITASAYTNVPSNWPVAPVLKSAPVIVPGRARALPGTIGATLQPVRVYVDGGKGKISGHVKIRPSSGPDVPAARKVILIDETTNRVTRSTWSRASDGYFEFPWIDLTRKYTAMTYDYAHSYRAVPADNVSAV